MRTLMMISAVLATGVCSAAFAQTVNPNTLDAQMQRLNGGAPAVAPAPAATDNGLPSPAKMFEAQATRKAMPGAVASTPANNAPAMAPTAAPAAGEAFDSMGGDAIPALPIEVQASGDISYLNGGISDEELTQLKSASSQYSLQLLISGTGGEYVSDVSIRILDTKGAVLVTVADAGPYLYVALKPGTYVVEASAGGQGQKFSVKTTSKGVVKKNIRVAG